MMTRAPEAGAVPSMGSSFGSRRAHLTLVEPARGVAQISNLSVSPGIASFGEVVQALAVARSVWSAWSLLPLSSLQPPTKAPASWTLSKRFARFACGCAGRAALRCIADFQSAGLEMSRLRGNSGSPAGWEPSDTADWKSLGNLRYIDLFDKAEMRPSLSRRQNRA